MVFMIAGGIILPLISAMIGFNEDISLRKWIAILVLIGAVYMTSKKDEDTGYTDRKGFWISCIGLAVFNGIYGTLLAIQQRLTSSAEREEMVAVTFCVAMMISGVVLVAREGNNFSTALKQTRKSGIYLFLCAVVMACAINLTVFVIPLVDMTILYTFDNSGVFLVSVLISRFFFNEKMSTLNWIGCITVCIALVGVATF